MTILAHGPGYIVCGADGHGSCVIAGKTWRWEDHHYCGPTFLRADGEPLKRQPGERHPVWDRYAEWRKRREAV